VRVAVPKYEPRAEAAPPPRRRHGGDQGHAHESIRRQTRSKRRSTSATGSTSARDRGPAIVEQFDATTVIPPGWRRAVDGYAI
jgi:N-methylhydantoinase A/oxoprolinase/acetone carboxylase beta subunit